MNRSSKTPAASANRGLTLIELLVVIAIVAMFAGLLLPAHARARHNAQAFGCLNNLEQFGRAVAMYAEEHQNYFPQVDDPHASGYTWWPPGSLGPPNNSLGHVMGSEWLCTDPYINSAPLNQPATPAPMLMPYLQSEMLWVCPKRKRGADYVVNGATVTGQRPSITGYISYGFNECGAFQVISSTGNMLNASPFKPTTISTPSQMVSIADCSGTVDPTANGTSLGALLDGVWLAQSGPSYPAGGGVPGFNFRFQSSYARHNNRANILYVDGHVAPALPSSLNYGQFVGVFSGTATINLSADGGPSGIPWASPISTPALDAQIFSGTPE